MNHARVARRDVLKTVSATLAVSNLARKVSANDRIAIGFIGMGGMGTGNLKFAMKHPEVAVVTVCDVYQPNRDRAAAIAGNRPKPVKDFREILADKSVDAVCISTPDHWHALMTIEACKAGKDVWVEKPVCTTVEEGHKMVQAARKYDRVVQAGTMQRSGDVFQKAVQIVRSGQLGKVTFCRTWNYDHTKEEGIGNPPDSDPPAGLDYDLWLGPAPKRPFNPNRFLARFRWFWDYAGGMMTDWGVHWLDIVQMAFGEAMPKAITMLGGRYYLKDNGQTPDTFEAVFEYPDCLVAYEYRAGNSESMFKKGAGILFHGTRGTLFVTRGVYILVPEKGSDLAPEEVKATNQANLAHWANFLQCIKSRQRPMSDIETGYRSTATCLLGNAAFRSRMRFDWDDRREKTRQREAHRYLTHEYRRPWKLVV